MDETEALENQATPNATPIFSVYRRGYDPEQVDRYVSEQQRRLDETTYRASESERKLAAAVGQLRELHRRVAVYESEARSTQPPALDTLGERVQRILQEAWEGAYNLRQEAEREVNELREQATAEMDTQRQQAQREVEELRTVASKEAADLVDEATRRALALRDEMDRRRQAYLERVERDRQHAVAQISYLYDQREMAVGELARLQATVQATVEEMMHSPLARTAAEIAGSARVISGTEEEEEEGAAAAAPPDERFVAIEDGEAEALRGESLPADEAPASFEDETLLVSRDDTLLEGEEASGPDTLFERIISDEEYRPSGATYGEGEAPSQAREELPTGPMDAVELDYSAPWSQAEGEATAASQEQAATKHSGIYDAETDDWV